MTKRETEKLKWNIEQQDLFGNMACILNLAKEDMEKKKISPDLGKLV